MNRLEIIGHIGNDAEVKDLGSNQVINFSVAVSESYIKKDTGEKVTNTTWFECAKWGNNTSIAQYLKKGTQVFISGKVNNRAWQNEQGEIKVVNGILINQIELLGSKQNNENNTTSQPQQASPQTSPIPTANNLPPTENDDDGDLPF